MRLLPLQLGPSWKTPTRSGSYSALLTSDYFYDLGRCLAFRILLFFFLAAIKLPLQLGTRGIFGLAIPLPSLFTESPMSDKYEVVPTSTQTGSSALALTGDTDGSKVEKLSGRHPTFTELLLPSKTLGKLAQT